ncbi:MAG: hypothetical protein AAF512_10925 [Pseudomonadota bacterium]
MKRVLFVCTGNVFRSVTAEYAVRTALGGQTDILTSSAGTAHAPELKIRKDVAIYLAKKGLDVSKHQRRTLSQAILNQADIVIAMSTDHQVTLQHEFQLDVPLYMEASGGQAMSLPDVDDLFQPEDFHSLAAQQHIYRIIDRIVEQSSRLAKRLKAESSCRR